VAVHVQGVVLDIELVDVGHHFLYALKARVTELEELVAVQADQVIVLPVTESPFILRLILSELMAYDEVAFEKQIQGIVYRRATHTTPLLLHMEVDLICVQVTIVGIDLFENGESFRRLPLVPLLQERAEDAFDLFEFFLR